MAKAVPPFAIPEFPVCRAGLAVDGFAAFPLTAPRPAQPDLIVAMPVILVYVAISAPPIPDAARSPQTG
ncbi:MAG TPA: hypothetical protein VFU74_16175 [Actinocrinis sp.]|nr:hypothetical protein [Actinocrinis sp.]